MLNPSASPREYWPTQAWRSAPPEAHGLRADLPIRLRAFGADPDAHVNGIVVVRHGYLVGEEYFGRFRPESLHTVASVTKSVVALLTGIVLGQQRLNLDQPFADWFPEIATLAVDPRIQEIRVRHLLSMTGGWAQIPYDLDNFTTRPSPVADALERPIAHEPGTMFWYDNLGAHLMAVLLSRAAAVNPGEATPDVVSTAAYARSALLGPLGIWTDQAPRFPWRTEAGGPHSWHARAAWDEASGYPWKQDRERQTTGYGGLHLTIRDMAKLGLLCASGGVWEGQALIPHSYLADALQPHSPGGSPGNTGYGYFWWVREAKGYAMAFAFGSGGQYVFVLPQLDLVVAVASTGTGQGGRHGDVETRELVDHVVLPALVG